MNITTRTSLMGFLLTLAALNAPGAIAATYSSAQNSVQNPGQNVVQPTVEARLSRLAAAIRDRETQLPDTQAAAMQPSDDLRIAIGWADGSRGGQWTDGSFGRGTASGPGGGQWTNGAYGRGTASGPGGGQWTNGAYGRGTASGPNSSWTNGAYGGSAWSNAWPDAGGFYNYHSPY